MFLSQISFIKDAKEIMEAKVKEDEAKPKPAFDPLLNINEIDDANTTNTTNITDTTVV